MTVAIILAAGRGSRLGSHTRRLPKALVSLGGRTLLDWNLAALAACGVRSTVVVGGYRAEQLRRDGVELVVSPTWQTDGPVSSLRAANPARFRDGFIVLYGDCVHHADNLAQMLDCCANIAVAGDRAWRALWSERHAEPLHDAETYRHANGALVAIGARPSTDDDVQAQFAGLLSFSAAGWQGTLLIIETHLPPSADMTTLLAALLERRVGIADVPIRGRWCEVDSTADLRFYRRKLRQPVAWSHDWRADAGGAACR